MGYDMKYGEVTVENEPGNRLNGEDEPVFVIRARDRASVATLMDYRNNACQEGAESKMLASVDTTIEQFEQWQSENHGLIKVPD